MKRVQIAGRSGRAYFDGMGNVMYTIGDYTPNIGDWVVTDGRYIYGHTATGGASVIVGTPTEGGVPYLVNGDEIWYIDDDLQRKPLLRSIIGIIFIINDDKHFLAAIYDANGGSVYDVLSGELMFILGNYIAYDDMDIDEDGNLLGINTGWHNYNFQKKITVEHYTLTARNKKEYNHSETNSPIPAYNHTDTSASETKEASVSKTFYYDLNSKNSRNTILYRNDTEREINADNFIDNAKWDLLEYAKILEYDTEGIPYPTGLNRPSMDSECYVLNVNYEYPRIDRNGLYSWYTNTSGSKPWLSWQPYSAMIYENNYYNSIMDEYSVRIILHIVIDGKYTYDETHDYDIRLCKTLAQSHVYQGTTYSDVNGSLSKVSEWHQAYVDTEQYTETYLSPPGKLHLYKDAYIDMHNYQQNQHVKTHRKRSHWDDGTGVVDSDDYSYFTFYDCYPHNQERLYIDKKTDDEFNYHIPVQDDYYIDFSSNGGTATLYGPNGTVRTFADFYNLRKTAVCEVPGGYVYLHPVDSVIETIDKDGNINRPSDNYAEQFRLRRYPNMEKIKKRLKDTISKIFEDMNGEPIPADWDWDISTD